MKQESSQKNPWIFSAKFDLIWIIGPGIFSVLILYSLDLAGLSSGIAGSGSGRTNGKAFPSWLWLVLVPGIDVSHVYSTLFRTYFDKRQWVERKTLLTIVPIFCFLAALILHSFGKTIFWRIMAYLAVFHFIRQQYGFLALYSSKEPRESKVLPFAWEKSTLYAVTIVPIVYWHTTPEGRNFEWFLDGDFFSFPQADIATYSLIFFWGWVFLYFISQVYSYLRSGRLSWPKNLLLLNTAIIWYVGIVVKNDDLSFTLTNIVNHGVPYMALLFMYGRFAKGNFPAIYYEAFKRIGSGVFAFIGTLILLSYSEEWLWDTFVWREHPQLFGNDPIVKSGIGRGLESVLVPLFFLPQFTHYVLDGFLWKIGKQNSELRNFFALPKKDE
ncbi:hypothetical protein EHO61_04820 [Leptospira fluminis]|uniref:Uncharacterized protein n=1 Tax=Leptospira fluminis TaxID=2484979 RepID=A0A4R9GSH6_9LEPT|nr:hypothetical protein [Leptospira fluminis]TGK21176.1 hypothetical protein EHO61_04820 [Leptospira fluminis]